jgi:hypothetical protein
MMEHVILLFFEQKKKDPICPVFEEFRASFGGDGPKRQHVEQAVKMRRKYL